MSRKNKPQGNGNSNQVLKSFNQLKKVTSRIPESPAHWESDGVDHICIDRKAATELGRALSTGTDINWSHPVLGFFRSLDNLWYFLSVGKPHDALRRLQRREAIEFARNECGGLAYYPNIEAVFLDSIYRYLKSKKHLVEKLTTCDLPFDIYYTNLGGIRSRRVTNLWMIDGYYEIQAALRENREPDLKPWVTHSEQHIYHDIMVALGADPATTEQSFKRAVETREQNRGRQRPRVEHNGRVIKERSIQSIDPLLTNTDTFKVKVREEPKKVWVGLPADEDEVDKSSVESVEVPVERTESSVAVETASGDEAVMGGTVQTTIIDPDTNFDSAVVTTIGGEPVVVTTVSGGPVVAEDGVLIDGAEVVHKDLETTTQEAADPYAYARGSEDDKEEVSGKSSDTTLVNHSV